MKLTERTVSVLRCTKTIRKTALAPRGLESPPLYARVTTIPTTQWHHKLIYNTMSLTRPLELQCSPVMEALDMAADKYFSPKIYAAQ
jgi:hypothetical protein